MGLRIRRRKSFALHDGTQAAATTGSQREQLGAARPLVGVAECGYQSRQEHLHPAVPVLHGARRGTSRYVQLRCGSAFARVTRAGFGETASARLSDLLADMRAA